MLLKVENTKSNVKCKASLRGKRLKEKRRIKALAPRFILACLSVPFPIQISSDHRLTVRYFRRDVILPRTFLITASIFSNLVGERFGLIEISSSLRAFSARLARLATMSRFSCRFLRKSFENVFFSIRFGLSYLRAWSEIGV